MRGIIDKGSKNDESVSMFKEMRKYDIIKAVRYCAVLIFFRELGF